MVSAGSLGETVLAPAGIDGGGSQECRSCAQQSPARLNEGEWPLLALTAAAATSSVALLECAGDLGEFLLFSVRISMTSKGWAAMEAKRRGKERHNVLNNRRTNAPVRSQQHHLQGLAQNRSL